MRTVEELTQYFKDDRFAMAQGMVIECVDEEKTVVSMQLEEVHKNALGFAQGGVVFTLADFTFAVACCSRHEGTVTLDAQIHFMRSPQQGKLTATARPRSDGRTICVYEIAVTDDKGAMVALMTATGFKK